MAARFFVQPEQVRDKQVIILGDDIKHITKVLRLGEGDMITVLDGTGSQYLVRLSELSRDRIVGQITEQAPSASEPGRQVTIVQGMPKGDKLETVIQKCTEIGAVEIVPLMTERSVVHLQTEKIGRKLERWQKIAQEAAEQSRRGRVPVVKPVSSWREFWSDTSRFDLVLIAWEEEHEVHLSSVLSQYSDAMRIALVIGPEGGLTPDEVDLARRMGAQIITLGPRILRTETASVALLSMVMYHYGEMGGRPGADRRI